MEVDIIIALSVAAVLLFAIAQGSRIIRSGAMHKTLRRAVEQGHPLTPELIERFDRAREPGSGDQRTGYVMVALALALLAAGVIQGNANDLRDLATAAIFPLFVGGALLLRLRLAARRETDA